ncbi:MAG: hypothetical protein E7130_06795 [Rikenellaceae bacterium]|nr:hypothetical protein [Rikenellaceae bacterium]
MKKLFLVLAVVAMILPSCGKINDAIDELGNRLDKLEQESIPTIDEQIANINTSITDLEAVDVALKEQIAELEKSDEATAEEISKLKVKDAELNQMINTLREYVNSLNQDTKDWVSATFATLEQYSDLAEEIASVKSLVETYKNEASQALATAINALDSSLKSWVGEQLSGYYTIAEMDAKITALQNALTDGDDALLAQLNLLKESLQTMKTEITEAYKQAIADAINTNNGVINTKIANEIATVNQRITDEVATINAKIVAIEARLDNVEAQLKDLLARIQSVTYIPTYDDGKATVRYYGGTSRATLDFEISPKDAVAELAKVWETALSVKAVYTQTRAVSFIDMPIVTFEADAENGVISVTASGENLSEEFFAGTQSASLRLAISDGNSSVTSEFVQMVAKEDISIIPNNNQIWYTSSDGNVVTLYKTDVFGANIVSNTYENGMGVITFDGDVTSIGYAAFANCSSLKSVTIGNGVTSIGVSAFYGCTSLTSITIPDSVTSIGSQAFCNCKSLTSVTIGNGVTDIGEKAFRACSSLTRVTIPDSITEIGRYAFDDCTSLTSVTIPDSVTSIGDRAFSHCASLTSITIPDSVTSIVSGAFSSCSSLTAFYGKFASEDNRCLIINGTLNSFAPAGITSYTIPDSITEIRSNAFYGCHSLTRVNIPDSVTEIGGFAFFDCTSLTTITIPDSVTKIGSSAFSDCPSLTAFYGKFASGDNRCLIIDGVLNVFAPAGITSYAIPDSITSIENNAFRNCTSLISVTIPDSVTTIRNHAFYCCTSLTSITIPDSVTSIGQYAFYGCKSLTSVYCKPTTPPTGGDSMFDDNASGRVIYVPTASVGAYKAARYWSVYASYIVGYDF